MKLKRIAILTAASLAWNPRALKEAGALSHAGFEVVVYGVVANPVGLEIDEELALRHGFKFVAAGVLSHSTTDRLVHYWARLRNRLGSEAARWFGFSNRWQLGRYVPELLRCAREAGADYYISHLESALWVGARLLRDGYRVGVDMEDWYSEDLLPEARKHRPIRLLRALEQTLLCGSKHSSCPSRAMSLALEKEFGCRPPTVIYNAFPWAERARLDGMFKDRQDRRVPSLHWYSQTLGRGRGLEDLFAALPHVVHPLEIHLRGNPAAGFETWMMQQVPPGWRPSVFVHGLVSNDELLSRIAEHDIGFAGEQRYCRSRDLTVTNKILHYLLGGLAVVASDTEGQCEIASVAKEAVLIYPAGNPRALADALNQLLGSSEQLRLAKAAALRAAKETFCWEKVSEILVESIKKALQEVPGAAGHSRTTAG